LSLGETRAPKQPYSTLAQLARCAPRGGGGGGGAGLSAAASRLALEHQPVSGLLQTTYRLRSLRRHVPELHPACGFWPNCTATRFVLPKECWARLEHDLRACEDSEPVLQNLIRRGREVRMNDGQYLADAKPGWRRVAIGAAGPVPEAALTMAPSDRLCLTAWRSMFVEGAPATFVNCPKQRSRNSRAAAKAAKTAGEAAKAARAAEAKALKAGASAERAQAAGKRAAQLVERVREEKVRTRHEEGSPPLAPPYAPLHAPLHTPLHTPSTNLTPPFHPLAHNHQVSTRLHEEGFGASAHSSWEIVPEIEHKIIHGIAAPGVAAAGGSAPRAVRLVPRSAPHMCLGAPAVLRAAEAGGAAGAVAEVQRAVAVQRAKRATKVARVNAERASKRAAKGRKGGGKGGGRHAKGARGKGSGGGKGGGKHAKGVRGKGGKRRPSGDGSSSDQR